MTIYVPHVGKITAAKTTLNALACVFIELELHEENETLRNLRTKQWESIQEALERAGYYDYLKKGTES